MKGVIRFIANEDEVNLNFNLIQNTLIHNQHNPYNKLEVPKKVYPRYKRTEMSFKVNNVINYYIEPTRTKDMMINLSQYGVARFEYSPMLEQKLEVYFNGE